MNCTILKGAMIVDIKELKKELKNLTLLYVEDEESARVRVEKLFSHIFNSIEIAENGKIAFDLYKNREFDLVITDITMPVMGGIELIKKIREINKDQAIIILTAHNTNENLLDAIDLQVDGFLLKPLEKDRMIELLYRVGKHIRAEKENISFKRNLESLVKTQQKKICELVETDRITGEYNYLKLKTTILDSNNPIVCLLVINHLFELLDFFGVDIYDTIIKKTSEFLKSITPKEFKFFHLRNNEFAIYADLKERSANIQNMCEEIDSFFIEIEGREIKIEFSTALLKNDKFSILKDADDALLKISQSKDLTKITFNKELAKERFKYLKIATEIIRNDLTYAIFQPIFTKSKEHKMFEVLCRVNHKEIAEDDEKRLKLFDSCKKAGLFSKLTHNVLLKVLDDIKKDEEHIFFINICENELNDKEFINSDIFTSLIELKNIILDVNTIALQDENSFSKLKELKNSGVKICFDNVGTTSIEVKKLIDSGFLPDFVKFDRTIVSNIDNNKAYVVLLQAYNLFTKNLNIKTVAVGIKNEECFNIAKEIDFNFYQGYYFKGSKDEAK